VLSWAPNERSQMFLVVRKRHKERHVSSKIKPARCADVRWHPGQMLVYLLVSLRPAENRYQHNTIMPLTNLKIRSAKPGSRLVKLSDGGGLQLWITSDGAKRWRLAYRFDGKQKLLAIGVYPTVVLREAREAREEAKRLLAAGRDPTVEKKLSKAAKAAASANTFEAIAKELLDKKRREGKAQQTMDK
jgi:hypothetical protein